MEKPAILISYPAICGKNSYKLIFFTSMLLAIQIPYVNSEPTYGETVKKGTQLLQMPESEINLFAKANLQGLSKDSLLYFWSESMIAKGCLDSALAANYLVKKPYPVGFKIDVMKQRYKIFKKLGWNSDAQKIIDTLRTYPEYRSKLLIPSFEFKISDKYKYNQDASRSVNRNTRSYHGTAGFTSTWVVLHKHLKLSWGLDGSISKRFYENSNFDSSLDTLGFYGALFVKTSGKHFTPSYTISISQNNITGVLIGNSVQSGYIGHDKSHSVFFLGVTLNNTNRGKFSDLRPWFYSQFWKLPINNFHITTSCLGTAVIAEKKVIGLPTQILYAYDARLQYPIFYKDASYTEIIDTISPFNLASEINNSFENISADKKIISFKIPLSYLSISPKATFTMKYFLPIEIELGYNLSYFPQHYERNQESRLVYSLADKRYYYVPDGKMIMIQGTDRGLASSPALEPLSRHFETRLDNSANVNVSILLCQGKIGTIRLKAFYTRTWSTLAEHCPVYIPKQRLFSSLSWSYKNASNVF